MIEEELPWSMEANRGIIDNIMKGQTITISVAADTSYILPLLQLTGTIPKCSIHFSKVYPHQLSPPSQDFLHCQCSSEINIFTFHPFCNFSVSVVPSRTKPQQHEIQDTNL